MMERVGGSFTGVTTNTNELLTVNSPSLTLTVTVADPNWLVAGVRVIVRFSPLPPKTMLFGGSIEGFDELAIIVRFSAEVSGSAIVNKIGSVGVSSTVDWSAILPMVGGADLVVSLRLQPPLIAPVSPRPSSNT